MFVSFIIWEKKYTSAPIMPVNIFRAPSFTALIFVVLLTYMGFGISLWYTISWQQTLRSTSVLQTGIQFMPFGFGSIASVAIAAWLIPRVAAQYIMAIGIATVIVSNLILALMPIQQGYWPQIFPATMITSFCPDFVYIAAQLIASNSVARKHQGVAGSLIGTLNLYGNSLGLGFAGTIESQVAGGHTVKELAFGYRAALYFGMAVAVVGLGLDFVFVRMPKDSREGWDETLENEQDVAIYASASAVDRPTTA
jgi:MFS family permease